MLTLRGTTGLLFRLYPPESERVEGNGFTVRLDKGTWEMRRGTVLIHREYTNSVISVSPERRMTWSDFVREHPANDGWERCFRHNGYLFYSKVTPDVAYFSAWANNKLVAIWVQSPGYHWQSRKPEHLEITDTVLTVRPASDLPDLFRIAKWITS